jgi:endonuclease/exonuclease/phosphatase family metal-dependent hydrolase
MRVAGWARTVRSFVVILIAVGLVAAAPTPAGAGHGRELRVMTQNLYLGSSLNPAIEATTLPEFLAAVAEIYGTVLATDFPARAEAIADQIERDHPDLIGLQEVTTWTVAPAGAPIPDFDFLQILDDELRARGLDYAVASVSRNATVGPVPLLLCAACLLTMQDRDVILVNRSTSGLTVTNAMNGRFQSQQVLPTAVGPLSFDRGWASIDATFEGSKFRFVNTHLEIETFADVQEAQARELIAGPLRTLRPVIAVGDFNSAADGSTTRSYKLLIKALFLDAWWTNLGKPGSTCCQAERLDNPVSQLASRIDLILVRVGLPTGAHRVGDRPFQDAPPRWPSDHAGVVATLRLF